MMNDKFKDFYRQYISYIAVALISAIYIATAIFQIGETGKTIQRIIGDGVVSFLFGVNVNHLMGMQGFINGDKDERVVKTIEAYGQIVDEISPYNNELDDWCDKLNAINYKKERTRMLARVGLKYSDCFDENGVVKPYVPKYGDNKAENRLEKKRYSVYKKAVWLKLTPLTSGSLLSEGNKTQDVYNFGKTKTQFVMQENSKDIVSKIVCGVIFGYYGISLIKDFSWVLLLWTALQVGIFLITGLVRMFSFYFYVTDEYKGRIVKKIDTLTKFKNYKLAGESYERKDKED